MVWQLLFIHEAAMMGDVGFIEEILRSDPGQLNAQDEAGKHP